MSFFVQSLGPAADKSNAEAIYKYVKKALRSPRTVSESDLRKAISDCIREARGTGGPTGGIRALKTYGYIALAKDGKSYQLLR